MTPSITAVSSATIAPKSSGLTRKGADKLFKFLIITPTIPGREDRLKRCIDSIVHQRVNGKPFADYVHVVVGDGFTPRVEGPYVLKSQSRGGFWGNPIRNEILAEYHAHLGERLLGVNGEYVLFVDDDNILLPGCFQRLCEHNEDIIISQMLCMGPKERQYTIPGAHEIRCGTLGSLNYCIRLSITEGCTWPEEKYEADWDFYAACRAKTKNVFVLNEFLSMWCKAGL